MSESSEQLLQSLRDEPEGLTLSSLLERHPNVARRTAQRWLARLVQQDRIAAFGRGGARRYALAEQQPADDPSRIPLTTASREVLAQIEQPIPARQPVGYREAFLLDYRPNETFYLPTPLRERLRGMGLLPQDQMPIAGTYGRELVERLLIDLSWASSRLEGNTYELLEAQRLIEEASAATGRDAVETQMILNHKAAIELLVENVDAIGFDRYTVLNLHSLLSENLLPNPRDEGRLREHTVETASSVYRPLAVPAKVAHLFDILLQKAAAIEDPFEQSFFALAHLPYLQPFADVNKRTSRLAANMPLIRAGLCPLTFLGVPRAVYVQAVLGVYELTRTELLRDLYVWAYERSTREYVAVRQGAAEPSRFRLAYRDVIKQAVREAVMQPALDPLDAMRAIIEEGVPSADQEDVRFVVSDELQRLHDGVLARYGLSRGDYQRWREANS